MLKIALQQFANFNVNLRKTKGFLLLFHVFLSGRRSIERTLSYLAMSSPFIFQLHWIIISFG